MYVTQQNNPEMLNFQTSATFMQETEALALELTNLWRQMALQNNSTVENQQNNQNERLQNLRSQIHNRLVHVLQVFPGFCDQVLLGPLSEWRQKQKEAQCGMEMADNALAAARDNFAFLSKIWLSVRNVFVMVTQCGQLNADVHDMALLLRNSLTHLLQRSMVMQIGRFSDSTDDAERESISDSEMNNEPKWVEDPPLVVRTTCEENITVRVNFLAYTAEIANVLQTVEPVICFFVKSPKELSLNEETARNLQKGVQDENFVPAGSVSEKEKRPIPTDRPGTTGTMPNKETGVAKFENLILNLRTGKRKTQMSVREGKEDANEERMRSKYTKYHLLVTWKMTVDQSMGLVANGQKVQLPTFCTLSPPFMMRVARSQDVKLFGQMFWDAISSDKESVTYEPQGDVNWGRLEKGLKYLFKKLTRVRELSHQEMKHLGKRLFGSQEKVPPTAMATRERIFDKKMMKDTEGKREMDFSFFDWYYDAAELIIDRGVAIGKTKSKPGVKSTDERKMASLFDQGVIQGFLSRPRAEKILRRCSLQDRTSAMLIRFSDHHPGHLTVSYIYVDRNPQHIRPLGRSFLTGLTLPSVVAMLIQINDIQNIFVGFTGDKNNRRHKYEQKQRLIVGHLFNTVEYYETHYEAPGFQMGSGDTTHYGSMFGSGRTSSNSTSMWSCSTPESVFSPSAPTPAFGQVAMDPNGRPIMLPSGQFMMQPPAQSPQQAVPEGVPMHLWSKIHQYSRDPRFMELLYSFERQISQTPGGAAASGSTSYDQAVPSPMLFGGGGRNTPLSPGASTPGLAYPTGGTQTPATFMHPNFPMHQQPGMCFNRSQMCNCPSCQQSPFGFDHNPMAMHRPMPGGFPVTSSPSPSPASRSDTPAVDFFGPTQPKGRYGPGMHQMYGMYPPMNAQSGYEAPMFGGFGGFGQNKPPNPIDPMAGAMQELDDGNELWTSAFTAAQADEPNHPPSVQ